MKKILIWLIKKTVFLLDILYVKKEDIVIFSQSNDRYDDNAKILFLYMQNNTKYKVYWLYDNVKHESDNFVKRYSLKGFHLFLKSKFVFVTHGLGDCGLYLENKKQIIQLWHGISIKNLGLLDNKNGKDEILKLKRESRRYNLFTVSSQIEKYYISSAFYIEPDKIIVSGTPRNDYLLDSASQMPKFLEKLYKDKKIFLYAPTFRDVGDTMFFPFEDVDYKALDAFLEAQNAVILLRPHPNDKKNNELLSNIVNEHKNLIFARNIEVGDIITLEPFLDGVITDYSSIYIDLLLKDVPAIFIPYDLQEYEKTRGLSYDYDFVTPGVKVKTQEEFLKAMKNALDGAKEFEKDRKFVKDMFHTHQNGGSCKRIVDALERLS